MQDSCQSGGTQKQQQHTYKLNTHFTSVIIRLSMEFNLIYAMGNALNYNRSEFTMLCICDLYACSGCVYGNIEAMAD